MVLDQTPAVQPSTRIVWIMLVGILAMSSASILIRLAMQYEVPSSVIAFYRLALATALISVPNVGRRVWREYAKLTKRSILLAVASGFCLGLHFACWITSLANTTVMSSVVFVSSTPLWIGVATPIILKERTSPVTWLGIAVAMLGGGIIGFGDLSAAAGNSSWGDFLALLGAVFAAAYLMIGRSCREKVSLGAYLWIVYGTAACLLLMWVVFSGLPLTGFSTNATLYLLALGIVPQLIGHTAANYIVRYLPATVVSVSILGEPVGSTILGMLVLREIPALIQIIGAIIIVAAIALTFLSRDKVPPIIATRVDSESSPERKV